MCLCYSASEMFFVQWFSLWQMTILPPLHCKVLGDRDCEFYCIWLFIAKKALSKWHILGIHHLWVDEFDSNLLTILMPAILWLRHLTSVWEVNSWDFDWLSKTLRSARVWISWILVIKMLVERLLLYCETFLVLTRPLCVLGDFL